ncbi:DJ-1/PfpI family protein [soil metagenome]
MAVVGVLVFDDVEVLDCCGPFEVFSIASRVALRRGYVEAPVYFRTSARSTAPVVARGGLLLLPSHTIDDHPPLDLLVVPGGVTDEAEADLHLIEWIERVSLGTSVTASVCNGAFLLATAGLLDGLQVTTHWDDVDALAARFPAVEVVRERRWVDEGAVVTSAGVSAGIDMALHLVARQEGDEIAEAAARQMEYRWDRGLDPPR